MEHKELRFQRLLSNDEVTNGEPVYLFNADRFVRNFVDLQTEFRKIYPNTRIAYSYKTNHIPGICKLVDTLGGYAEGSIVYGGRSRVLYDSTQYRPCYFQRADPREIYGGHLKV